MGSIKNFIKFNSNLRRIYRRVGSIVFSMYGLFNPIKSNRVLFVSFGGRQYSDSPKSIYETMKCDPSFSKYELAWAFSDPIAHDNIDCIKLRIDTPEYFQYALSSKVWITNTSICRGLQFKKKDTICVNTWHGTPLKKMGFSRDSNMRFREQVDIGCCQSDFDRSIFLRLFNVREEDLLSVDLPRNDELLLYSREDISRIRNELGIPENKRVLLYMPTYRDYNLDEDYVNYFVPPMDIEKWEQELNDDWVLLVRFHYLVEKAMTIPKTAFCINVTNYENLNDLYAVSDVLVSDYSSSYIDYSILGRPMLCFAYDYDRYSSWRGFELDFEKTIPCHIDRTEDELIRSIKTLDYETMSAATEQFRDRFAPNAGHATEAIVEELKRRLGVN